MNIGTMLGIGGADSSTGGAGMNFQAGTASLNQPTTSAQALDAKKAADDALKQQQQAMSGQVSAAGQTQAFANAAAAQNGFANQSNVFQQQQALANQLGQQAQGGGPNPALEQLNQTTSQNNQAAASTIASQKGVNNAGLTARMAGNQAAQSNQQAAGQAATMRANQQLSAQQQLMQQQGALQNASSQQISNQFGGVNAVNQAQAGLTSAAQGITGAAQSEQQRMLDSINNQNQQNVAMQSNINNVNGSLSNTVAKGQQDTQGGLLKGAAMGMMAYKGGMIPKMADGGDVPSPEMPVSTPMPAAPMQGAPQLMSNPFQSAITPSMAPPSGPTAPSSFVGQMLKGDESGKSEAAQGGEALGGAMSKGLKSIIGGGGGADAADEGGGSEAASDIMAGGGDDSGGGGGDSGGGMAQVIAKILPLVASKGGKVPVLVSPGEVYLPPKKAKEVAAEGKNPLKHGEKIPGKAKVKGDSIKNDTVPRSLESGGIVIPKSVIEGEDAVKHAIAFVRAHLAKRGLK